MGLPVACIDVRVGNRVPAVDHHSPAHIDTHMGDARRVVGPHKKDQVAGFCLGAGYRGAKVIKPLGGLPSHAPSGMIDDPAHEAGTVKRGGRGRTAPHVRVAQVLFRLGDHGRKGFILQGLRGNVIVLLLEIENVFGGYGNGDILKGISCSADYGDVLCLLGRCV